MSKSNQAEVEKIVENLYPHIPDVSASDAECRFFCGLIRDYVFIPRKLNILCNMVMSPMFKKLPADTSQDTIKLISTQFAAYSGFNDNLCHECAQVVVEFRRLKRSKT